MKQTETMPVTGPRRSPLAILLAAGLAGLLLTGCAGGETFEYTDISEIPEGPGLVSGPEGELTIVKYDPFSRSSSSSAASTATPAPEATVSSTSGITEAVTPE